jgi:hypothetical protein
MDSSVFQIMIFCQTRMELKASDILQRVQQREEMSEMVKKNPRLHSAIKSFEEAYSVCLQGNPHFSTLKELYHEISWYQ